MIQQQQPKPASIDWLTLVLYFVFVIGGLLCIYASVYREEYPMIYDTNMNYGKQLIWIGLSFFIGILILFVDEKFFYAFAYPIYGISIFLLIAVLLVGTTVKGSSSWIEIAGFRMQPAEFAKFGAALALAKFLSGFNVKFSDKKTQIIAGIISFLPLFIILFQNETGSALVFGSFIFVLYREGLSGWLLFLGFVVILLSVLALVMHALYLSIAIAIIAALFTLVIRRTRQNILIVIGVTIAMIAYVGSVDYVFENVLQAHQKSRINVLLGKEVDLKGAGYNVMQSKIAIGSGGLFGKGYLEGTQNKFRFVPEQSTDFIFCTIGEEFGFVGSLAFIILYMLFLWRIVHLAERQRYKFNRIYGYSVASILFFHFLINIGMTLGLMPIIGIPLPFFSYGGSSLLSFTILLFIFIRLDANKVNELRGAFD
ncbi:MAG: rod shape-determining protein RodA [Bacteroidia bacterium]|nr:rod shape-determining protein RodA [Bacteroidia bacterium]MBP9688939.1 rod shape-determining protein RodA [Bacteroidia bacterium]